MTHILSSTLIDVVLRKSLMENPRRWIGFSEDDGTNAAQPPIPSWREIERVCRVALFIGVFKFAPPIPLPIMLLGIFVTARMAVLPYLHYLDRYLNLARETSREASESEPIA